MNALDVLPPEVNHHYHGKSGGERIVGNVNVVAQVVEGVVEKSGDVLAGRYRADGAGEDVVEQKGGNRQLGQGPTHGLLDYTVDAPADEHGARLDVDGPDRVAEKHDSENEPGSAFADHFFRVTAHVVRRRGEVGQDNGCGPPEGNESQHHRGGDEDFDGGPLQILGLCGHSGSCGPEQHSVRRCNRSTSVYCL